VYAGFNIVYADYANNALPSQYYYNLPTQIASRADNYKVISQVGYGANSNALTDINATVKIELVDADTSETCSTMTPISDHTWITFDNSGTTDLYADDIITGSIIYDTNASRQFFKKAAKNVKFRISYSRADTDGLITFTKDDNGKYHLENFPAYAGSTCVNAFDATVFNGNATTQHHYTQVPEACANNGNGNGNSGMTQHELSVCMECLYGTNVTYTCSQDNFSIRPEGFLVKINDQNQTTGGSKSTIALNTNPTAINLASGYLYSTEVNATNHIDSFPPTDYNTSSAMFSWRWTPGTVNVSGCNDTSDKNTTLTFSAGMTDTNISVAQVGNYQLDVIDSSWTAVDRSPSGHTSPYYVTTADADCVVGSNATSAVKISDIGSNPSINGCNIGSDHTNSVEGVTYYDNNATFHPYTIDISTMAFSKGTTPTPITSGSNAFVYTSDLSRDDSMNMSLRASGNIKALSYSNTVLSNFVADCYAKDLNLTLHSSNNLTLDNGTYQIRFMDYNSSGSLIYDSNATNVTTTNLSIPLFQISDGNFTKDTNGSLSTLSRINYDHNHTRPTNPITAQLHHLSIQCSTPSECQMYADGISSHEANSTASMDMNITYAYGRVIPRDVRVFGSSSFTANAWYEVYNASSLLGTTLQPSRNTSLWYINAEHNVSNDGNASVSVILPSLNLLSTSNSAGVETYTFAGTNPVYSGIAHINTDPWLWYGANASEYADPINATNLDCLTHPCFNINIVPNMGRAGSATSESLRNTKSNKSTTTNRVTYDYSPSTR
ncbi:hypothetical protein, partial [Sulfuricurvum sp.]|uniref:hypothetical protein n=1 Tax=Sulfuricurvum sp. TaxID=2025608 RepID=UPI003BB4C934